MSKAKSNFHVVKLGIGWSVKSNKRVLSSHNTQRKAVDSAITRAKRAKTRW